jgi:hypothetical protein
MYTQRLFDNPPSVNNWIDCAADPAEMNAAFDIADAEANSDKGIHDWFAKYQGDRRAPSDIFVGRLADLVRDIERREHFTLGTFPAECLAYALAVCWIDAQQGQPHDFSGWLDFHKGKAGARRYVMAYDPKDGTKIARNSIYARSKKEAEQLATRIGGLFGFRDIKVSEVK